MEISASKTHENKRATWEAGDGIQLEDWYGVRTVFV
jgi:hypothetical protein